MFAQEVLHSDMKAAAVEELEVQICNFIIGKELEPAMDACQLDVPSRAGMLAARAAVAALIAWESGYRHSAEQSADEYQALEAKVKELEGECDVAETALVEIEQATEKALAAKSGAVAFRPVLEQVKATATEALGPSEEDEAAAKP